MEGCNNDKIILEYEDEDFKKLPVKKLYSEYFGNTVPETKTISDMSNTEIKANQQLARSKCDNMKQMTDYIYNNLDFDEYIKDPRNRAEISVLVSHRIYNRKYKKLFARARYGAIPRNGPIKQTRTSRNGKLGRKSKLDSLTIDQKEEIYHFYNNNGLNKTKEQFNLSDNLIHKIIDNYIEILQSLNNTTLNQIED
jgi:hypothetical protein